MGDAEAERKLRAARAKVSFVRPYFSRGVFSLVLVESERCPTMAVDAHKRLYWNPSFVRKHDIGQLTTVLLHELGHVLRGHHKRAHAMGITSANHVAANLAQDCELNDDIRDDAKKGDISELPNGAIYPATLGCPDYKPWEFYYLHIRNNLTVTSLSTAEGLGAPGGSSDGDEGNSVQMPHDCGSGAHGVPRPWELGDPVTSGVEGVSDADWRDVERLTAQAMAERQRARGDVPGSWVEWSDALLKPKPIPWDQELSSCLRGSLHDVAGDVFHSYRRPSRRQSASPDIIFPCMRRPHPFVGIVGDTSMSMGSDDLSYVRGVVSDICLAMNARVAFIATDAAVHHGTQMVHDGRDVVLAGRGGTDMRVGIEYALSGSVRPRPDILVVVTDCETPWPAVAPSVKTIVCAIGDSSQIEGVPSWARVIRVDPRVRKSA